MATAATLLALGTVQFGLDYGVTHDGGCVPETEVRNILAKARDAGIDTLDTAAVYGDAEDVLGRVGAGPNFRIVTKTQPLALGAHSAEAVQRMQSRFHASLEKLSVPAVDGVLVHSVADLMSPVGDQLWRQLAAWRSQGLTRRIGVSIYDRTDMDAVLDRFAPDLVQLPLNVLDQRLLRDGTVSRLTDLGIAVHVRSVFLQGLLLQEPASCPLHLASTKPHLERWWKMCREHHISPLTAALRFGLAVQGVEKLVVGVHSAAHLEAILAAVQADCPALDWSELAAQDGDVVDPRRWPKA